MGGLMKSKIVEANEKIAEDVTTGFQKIQDGVVNGYKKIEDSFISRYLLRKGESLDEAKEAAQERRTGNRNQINIQEIENEKENLDYRTSHSRGGQLSLRFL